MMMISFFVMQNQNQLMKTQTAPLNKKQIEYVIESWMIFHSIGRVLFI